ncbi:MAG: P1 family peptidase [Acidobacteriota bacterium]
MKNLWVTLLLSAIMTPLLSVQGKSRARELGIPFEGDPGPLNAITDVSGVEVGHTTLISGSGKLEVGRGPVRTGVTAVLPRGKDSNDPVFAGWFPLNGNGEMTGTTWVEESGFLEGPILITNTHSVGIVRDAAIAWQVQHRRFFQPWMLPVVAETYDGHLNDVNGFHVKEQHVFQALDGARSGPVTEGNVGGGTGMVCYGFKGGIGTASRKVESAGGQYMLGVLVQSNFGRRSQLTIAGVPVGRELQEGIPYADLPGPGNLKVGDAGSIIVVVATDAPLLPHQLKRVARRVSLGIARTGGLAMNGSGDIFIAFSNANPEVARADKITAVSMIPNDALNALFYATAQATEEAIINALVAAETMIGVDDHRVEALPHESLRDIMRRFGRLSGQR